MRFWKMNGAGNDFLILNNLEEHLPQDRFPAIARTLCERRLSIGADGLMVVDAAQNGGDFRMLFYNCDGSMGEMCGNGARCICRYGYETGLSGAKQTVETTAGIVTGERIDARNYRIRLNDPSVIDLDRTVEIDGVSYPCAYVELGNPGIPHAVLPYPNLRNADEDALRRLGRALRYHPAFPKGANVNFYERLGESEYFERTYERGVEDFTYACGTGTGSLAAVLTLRGETDGRDVRVHMTGGLLRVTLDTDGEKVLNLWLSGPTNTVAVGEVTDDNIKSDLEGKK